MKKFLSYLFIPMVMIAVSCSQGFKKTKSGLLYKIISEGKGPVAKKGDFLKFDYIQKVHDSVLRTTINNFPAYSPVDSVGPVYDPTEIFHLFRKGDSAVVIMLVDTLLKKYGSQQLPPFLKKNDKIVLTFKVLDVFSSQNLAMEDRTKLFDNEKEKEIKSIQAYLAKNNITTAQQTRNGAFYQIVTPGDGPKVDTGKLVSVRYTGYSFDGIPFDSNIDSTKQSQPHPMSLFQFKAGVSGAIPGMTEAITAFKKGDKGKLYIPGMLGYGPQGSPPEIKPFENLMFDIEVVDITDAPKQQPGQGRGQLTPEQLQQLKEQLQKRSK
jgi:FKBP-type peptidyl-prolyl cis-trans isomerase FkpA